MKRVLGFLGGLIAIFLIIGIVLPYVYLGSSRDFQEVSITGNDYHLNGYLSKGNNPEGMWIILTHGNRKDGQSHELYQKIRENIPNPHSVLAIDFRGFGNSSSEGLENSEQIIDRIPDIESTVNYLRENFGVREDQIVLIGHSLGASQVMRAAVDHEYKMAIPIGLGDWDSVLADQEELESYSQKYFVNTGVQVSTDQILSEGQQFLSEYLFSDCPDTPAWLIFSSRDDGFEALSPKLQEIHALCGEELQWSKIPFTNHMYGTEFDRLPNTVAKIISNINMSLLMLRMNLILESI